MFEYAANIFSDEGHFIKDWFVNKKAVTRNGEHCKQMTEDYFIPQLEEIDEDNCYFQLGGATRHT